MIDETVTMILAAQWEMLANRLARRVEYSDAHGTLPYISRDEVEQVIWLLRHQYGT